MQKAKGKPKRKKIGNHRGADGRAAPEKPKPAQQQQRAVAKEGEEKEAENDVS